MKGWKEIYFNDFIKLNRGFDLTNSQLIEGEFPVVNSTEIKFYHKSYKVNGPGVITGRSGSLGTVQYVEDKYWPHNTTLYVKDFKGNHPKFVYYFLQMMHLENFNSGAGVPTLNQNHLHKQKIIVPIPETQQRIASILSAYDDLIEVNNQRIKTLEQTARELYKEWFVRMRFPGYKEVKFKKGIPEGWITEKFEKHIKIVRGKSYTSQEIDDNIGEYPFINLKNMNRGGGFRLDGTKYFTGKFKKEQIVTPGDIVMAVTDMTQDRLIVGRVARVPLTEHKEYLISLDIAKIIPVELPSEFLYSTLRFNYYGESLAELANGTNVLHLSPDLLKKYPLLIPPMSLTQLFSKKVNSIYDLMDLLAIQNTQLRQIRDRLLPRLISGKLQVKAEKQEAKIVPLQNNNIQTEENNKAKAYFKRRVLAAYIIDHLKDENTFGHVKLMKLMYLCEHLAKIETVSNYHRDAAGPYDNQMIRSIDSQLKKAKWFECVKENQKYTYRALEKKDEYKSWFINYYAEYEIGIMSLLNIFGKQKTIEAEKVATLYEAYRFLNEKKTTFTDMDILNEVLNNWHESKQRISENEWQNCLNWMREKKWIN